MENNIGPVHDLSKSAFGVLSTFKIFYSKDEGSTTGSVRAKQL